VAASDSVAKILLYSLPIWLLVLGVVLLPVTGTPLLPRKPIGPNQAKFKSLRTTSPILNTLVMVSVVGKPFLEHIRKNNWDTSFIAPQIATPLVTVFIISLYALLAAILIFFFRAIRNINVLRGERLRSPYSVLFMLVPITNLIVIPYLEYFTYQRSRALAAPDRASKPRAALLVGSAFALLIASVAFGLPADDASGPGIYDPVALLVLGFSTGCASGILTTRVINGIFEAQDMLAQRTIGTREGMVIAASDDRKHRIETLKLNLVAILVVVAFATALFPSLPSRILQEIFHA
jgi:hypothetical protein